MPAGFTAAIRRWRVAIVFTWALIGVGGLFASTNLTGRLTTSLAVPSSESARAALILRTHFADSVEGDFSVVVPVTRANATGVESRLGAAVGAVPGLAISQEKVDGDILIAGITSALDLRDASNLTQPLRDAIATQHLRGALVTGPAALQHDLSPVLAADLRRGEVIGGALALLVSVAVLGLGAEALIPLLVAGAAMGAALILLDALSHVVTLVLYTPNVVVLVGLGLAVDYTLLWLRRVRDERQLGRADPMLAAAPTRRTLVVAALVATTGLATMLAVPIPFLRSLGVAGLVVPVCALGATMSLAPALSSFIAARRVRKHRRAGQFWVRWSHTVVTRPSLVLAGSLVVLAILSAPLGGLSLTAGSLRAVPGGLPSTEALALIEAHVGVGVVAPVQIVLDAGHAHVSDPAIRAARNALAARILSLADVAVVAEGETPPYVDATQRYERVIVVTQEDFASPATSSLVAKIRAAVVAVHFPAGVSVSVGGAPAQARDFVTRVGSSLPLVIAGALVLAGIILWLAFSSLPIALLAILLDLASVAGALGVLTAVFRDGVGASVLHTYRVDAIESWVPVFLFAVLFGLSMDYEVFVVGAVREARQRGLASTTAIEQALSATGPVVTGAAGVMVAALVGLVIGRVAGLEELGVGLAAGVVIDALIVRALVLPSVLALLGERAWR